MRLITHNMLASNVKGVKNGFPLKIEATKIETREAEYNPDFLRHMYPKLEWAAFRSAAAGLGLEGLPEAVEPAMLEDDTFMRAFHHCLMEVHVEEGSLTCPESGRKFPITKGIPNMLLDEDLTPDDA